MARFTRRLVIFASSLFSVSVATDPASQAEPISLSPLSPVQQRNVLHERASDGSYLIATAIYTNAQNDSALQCWEFATPFTESSSAGAAGAETLTFFDLANMTYTHIPPRFAGGVHNAPMPQLVLTLAGSVVVTLPHGPDRLLSIAGQQNTLFLAVDSTGTGHNTTYPSDEWSSLMQLPFVGGPDGIPEHKVMHDGPCDGGRSVWQGSVYVEDEIEEEKLEDAGAGA